MDLRCSGSVRLLDDYSNLFFAHDTWDSFGSMVRMYKHYNWVWRNRDGSDRVAAISMSSTPGWLSSIDDFYITHYGPAAEDALLVAETTNGLPDKSLAQLLSPTGGLWSWVRAMAANMLATSGLEWTSIFAQHNGGTYNNQWYIVDTSKWSYGQKPQAGSGLLWIIEQIPEYTHSGDVTDVLVEQGYWASYNIPFFEDIYNRSGFAQQQGDDWSYTKCPRCKIFARDLPTVHSLQEYQAVMTYNDWQNDPLSLGDPRNGIMSRFDLREKNAAAFGGIDSKVTDIAMGRQRQALAMNGPTHAQQPVFEWTARWDSVKHEGEASRFDFDYTLMRPGGIS